ncbi:hypothetical protein FTO25_17280, partial [Klebsiella pneumoniae]
ASPHTSRYATHDSGTLWIAGPSMVGDFHPLISNRSPGAHCFYNQYGNIVFFQIQAEQEINQIASLACAWNFVYCFRK